MRRLEVDGIPAVLAPVTGPAHAGLVFRVGTADEPLARRGITRLVEHLVTDGLGVTGRTSWTTGPEHTWFHVQGSPAEITEFLTGVCGALSNPPTERLATVRDLVQGARPDRDPLPMWRHGARGFGVVSYPEWALPGLTEAHLREWIAHWFTRDNAALWLAGDVPEGLRLDLPAGIRQPPPPAATTLPATPAWFTGGVGWDTVIARGPGAAVFANVLERRVHRELRDLTEQIRTEYVPRSDGTARILTVADPLPGRAEAALGALVDVLAAVRAGQIDPDEVAAVVKLTAEGLRDSESRGARLPGQAFNLLAGREVQTLEEALAEVRAVTAAEVAGVATEAYAAGLLMVPPGSTAEWAGYTAAPAMSDTVPPGRVHRGRRDRALRLISGDEGVGVTGHGVVAAVRWDSCAALLAWPDGGRRLIGEDAVTVRVEPTLYRGADRVVREVDARVPERLRIEMPPRDRDDIPQPEPAPRDGGARRHAVAALCGVLALFFLGGGLWLLIQLLTGAETDNPRGEELLVLAGSLVFGALLARSGWAAARELGSRRG
ncbi:insulinase family protein [Actinoplanes sp. CA-252034]|uniref:insulinase family protein n=1 Tax=Actinoplanes sp. CA-252034 TaxID=3239906 RepID=UPI003D973E99